MTTTRLDFDILERPSWRIKQSSEIIRELVSDVIRFSGYPQSKSIETEWAKWLECTKAQHCSDHRKCFGVLKTLKLLLFDHVEDCNPDNNLVKKMWQWKDDVCHLTTVYSALERYDSFRDKQKLITVDVILQLHKLLPNKRFPQDVGRLRYNPVPVCTIRPDGTRYEYPRKTEQELSADLYNLIDYHNEHMMYYYKELKPQCSVKLDVKITYIIKCAAWLFCQMIALHPFGDGNGRISRLLANQVLSELMIVPCVKFFNFGDINRDHYLEALIKFQDHKDPGNFAALIVDALRDGWMASKPKPFPTLQLYLM